MDIGIVLEPGPAITRRVRDQDFGKRVFKRASDARFPLKPLYGPNLAREIVKAQSLTQFETIAPREGVEGCHGAVTPE